METAIFGQVGPVYITLRGVLWFLLLGAYATASLFLAGSKGVRVPLAARALCWGFGGMMLCGRAASLLLDRSARIAPFAGGELVFFALLGFFAFLRLGFRHAPKAHKRLLSLLAPPFFAFTALMYLLRQGSAGAVCGAGGPFTYTDGSGFRRWNVPLMQALALGLLLAAAYGASCLKRDRFRVRLLPMLLMATGVLLPFEALRDTSIMRVIGLQAEAFAMLLTLLALLTVCGLERLREAELPRSLKLAALLLPALACACSFFALRAGYALVSFLLTVLPCGALLSPLFPFFKRPIRVSAAPRRRRFN